MNWAQFSCLYSSYI